MNQYGPTDARREDVARMMSELDRKDNQKELQRKSAQASSPPPDHFVQAARDILSAHQHETESAPSTAVHDVETSLARMQNATGVCTTPVSREEPSPTSQSLTRMQDATGLRH